MTEPLSGRDGTQALPGTDALAAPAPRRGEDPPLALPALPVLPSATDRDAVARWMDDDADASRRASDPPGVRDAGPTRIVPATGRRPEPRPSPRPRGRVRRAPAEPEPDWQRERREEAEFRSEFGEWRPGAAGAGGRPRSGRGIGGGTVFVLLVLLVIVVLIALA